MTAEGVAVLDRFLRRTDMRTGQGDFWNYDFSYIPVELLSGLTTITKLAGLEQATRYAELHSQLDNGVFRYFGLKPEDQKLVLETVEVLLPSVRPRSFKSLDTVAQAVARKDDFDAYAQALAESLTTWRTRTKGRGRFAVHVISSDPRRHGPSGIIRIFVHSRKN